jgi:hypothetical protein
MKGRVYKRCTTCRTNVKSRKHRDTCEGTRTTWAFVVDAGRDADGKRSRVSRSGYGTEREALRAMREVLDKVRDRTHVERSRVTVADYLRDEWLPATAPPRVGHGTHAKRTGHVETYIAPGIGGAALQELNAAHVNRLYAELLTGGKVDGGRRSRPRPATTCIARYAGRSQTGSDGAWSSTTRPTGPTLHRSVPWRPSGVRRCGSGQPTSWPDSSGP